MKTTILQSAPIGRSLSVLLFPTSPHSSLLLVGDDAGVCFFASKHMFETGAIPPFLANPTSPSHARINRSDLSRSAQIKPAGTLQTAASCAWTAVNLAGLASLELGLVPLRFHRRTSDPPSGSLTFTPMGPFWLGFQGKEDGRRKQVTPPGQECMHHRASPGVTNPIHMEEGAPR